MHACVHACKRVPNFDARSNAKDVLRRGRVGSTLIVDPLPYLKQQHHITEVRCTISKFVQIQKGEIEIEKGSCRYIYRDRDIGRRNGTGR